MVRCGCNTSSGTTCDAIMSCVATATGHGLSVNQATGNLELRFSSDTGNAARPGSDEGLWAPVPEGPVQRQWPRTIAGLPDQAIGAVGGGNLVGATTSPQMIEYAVANNLDIYATFYYALADEVAFESVGGYDTDISGYTDSPGGIAYGELSSLQMGSLMYDPGTRVSPTGSFGGVPSQFQSPPGGWGGYYSQEFGPRTVPELLRIIRGRIVVSLRAVRGRSDTDSARDVAAAVRAVVEAGAQDWVVVHVNAQNDVGGRTPLADLVQMVTGAGIVAGVNMFREDQIDVPFSPAEIAATGAQWVVVGGPGRGFPMTESRISEFVAAGLQVEAATNARQFWTQRMFALGCRAVTGADGVYARGGRGQAGDLDYRQTFIPGLATGTTATGALTPRTDQQTAFFNAGFARRDQPGRWFPERYGWVDGQPLYPNTQLLGTICPIPNATDYRIHLRVWRSDRGTSITTAMFGGLFFGALDDRDVSNFAPNQLGYSAQLHPPASSAGWKHMSLERHDGHGYTSTLAESDAGPGWAYEEWTDLVVTVQGSSITVTATASTGTATITANDTTYRGPYAAYIWYETRGGPILHGYDNPIELVMYESLS